MPAEQGGGREDQADPREVGQPGGQARQEHLLPARGPRLRRVALVEAQLLPEQDELQRLVVAAAGEGADEVEEEREQDVEGEERHRQAPLVVRGIGKSSVPQRHVA